MATCFKCNKEIYFSNKIEINGKEEVVCGACHDMKCYYCGKTRSDDVTRWTLRADHDTGELITVGNCCTTVEGRTDDFQRYSNKYYKMKQSDPELLQNIVNEGQRKAEERAKVFQKPEVAEHMIDKWSLREKLKKNRGKGRKK